tara:strand:+ start:621 stop:1139 length:519 start_codon:yes stop_codon:yes gene_type:complete
MQESVLFMYHNFKPANLLVCYHDLDEWQLDRVKSIGPDICRVDPNNLTRLYPNKHEVFINAPIIFNDTKLFRKFLSEDRVMVPPDEAPLSLEAFGLPPEFELEPDAILSARPRIKMKYKRIGPTSRGRANATPHNRRWWLNAMRDGVCFEEVKDAPEHLGWKIYLAYRWKKT